MKKNKNIKALAFSLIGGLSSLTTLPLAAISCKENLDIVKDELTAIYNKAYPRKVKEETKEPEKVDNGDDLDTGLEDII